MKTNVTYSNDLAGQVLKRKVSVSGNDLTEHWYRFGGKETGYVGNNASFNIAANTPLGNG